MRVVVNKKAQFKIQQMAFMLVALVLFFILAGLFFINFQFRGLKQDVSELNREKSISALAVISDMPELNCNQRESFCLDADKLIVMGDKQDEYAGFLPVASIEVFKLGADFTNLVNCRNDNFDLCNYFSVYDSGQADSEKYSTYVVICQRAMDRDSSYVYDNCKIGKLVVGVVLK